MSDLDMELQTIRQKLQTLKAAPPETIAAPWGQSRSVPSPNLAQVTTAIETLRQRSSSPQSLGLAMAPANLSSPSLQQFDIALANVEQLAQQQQQALYRLKAQGDRLTQQIQPGTSPQIDHIAHFLATCNTLQIPTIQKNNEGYLSLAYYPVNFHQAENDATSNAEKLRLRSQLFKPGIDHPQREILGLDESPYDGPTPGGFLEDLGHFYQLAIRAIQQWFNHYLPPPRARSPRSQRFTLLDASIWCIGAAIVRIILNQVFQFYPALWTPVALMLIAGLIISLYQAIFSVRPNPVLGYRTLVIILGLLIGGRFS
ncbi:hypothetical protein [Leptothoe sp. PORK10 BA2]|uniref:hypothetical protein n=1 Tax=Leptothoe sp. PORK10 BA2 TaxID=3110254 RepID=UPI002B205028|nr:hypothetical protein [Leptothoe sp. PORK10 BA2]MEA5466020.1 hypothetical protein [Leptothoe sp. PORK10 BA2]